MNAQPRTPPEWTQLAAALARAVTVDEVAKGALELGLPALGAVAGGFFLVQPSGSIRLHHLHGYGRFSEDPYGELPLEAPLPAAECIRTGLPVWLAGAKAYLSRYPSVPPAHLEPYGAWAALPLEGRERCVGALAVSFSATQTFDAAQTEQLLHFAFLCGQALDRARLFESERDARAQAQLAVERLALLVETSRILANDAPAHGLLTAVTSQVSRGLGPLCAVALLDPDGQQRGQVFVHHPDAQVAERARQAWVGTPFRMGEGGAGPLEARALKELSVLVPTSSLESSAAVSLRHGQRVLGVLMVAREKSRPYQAPDSLLLEDLAQRLALALVSAERRQAGEAHLLERAAALRASEVAHQTLLETQRRLRAALEAAEIGTYFWDMRTGAVEHDPGVKRIFGFAEHEGEGLDDYTARVHPDDRPAWLMGLRQAQEDGKDLELRYRIVLPGGEVRWVLDQGRLTKDAQGNRTSLAGAVVNVTAEYRAREHAESANRAKDEFLAMLGHELRNPLSPILTSLELMELRGKELLVKERAVIERQVQHMVRLVDDLLDISRITRGKVELKKRRVELADVIAQAVETSSPLLELRSHALELDLPARGLPVLADPDRLAQVVSNLLANAAKYTAPRGRIRLVGGLRGDEVFLRVEDSGAGIPPALLPRIFDLFVQGDRSLERSQGGLGLGLAVVRSLVQLHGGRVEVFSEGVNRGSQFVVSLPLAKGMENAPLPTPFFREREGAKSFPRRRVLVVDDNRDAAEALGDALEYEGHLVKLAYDGPQALEVAREFTPELVFLDIGLPVMDGYEVARKLREWLPPDEMMLVALTGYGQPSDRARSLEAGFDRHLTKPVGLEVPLSIAAKLDAAP